MSIVTMNWDREALNEFVDCLNASKIRNVGHTGYLENWEVWYTGDEAVLVNTLVTEDE